MSGGLVEELREIPLDKENQDLKEILEIAFQITAQLEVENIIKNVVWSLVAKYQTETVTFLLPGEIDDDLVTVVSYRGVKREDVGTRLPSILPVLTFLDKDEYSQIPFSYFRDNYTDESMVATLNAMGVDVIVPLRTDKGAIGILLLPKNGEGQRYGLQEIQYITRIVRFAAIAIENASLFRQATTDRMTGLFSHHFFQKNLEEEMERARRYKSTFSLLMVDIDHFKNVNDAYGHLQGDRIIKDIAKVLSRSIRQVDFPARYGGEEFAVILPSVDVKGALVVAERLRKRIDEYAFPGDGESLHVTISVGVTEFDPEADYAPSDVVRDADKALYRSKESGRNRVNVSPGA